jgi:uncharacterized Zn-finger protein
MLSSPAPRVALTVRNTAAEGVVYEEGFDVMEESIEVSCDDSTSPSPLTEHPRINLAVLPEGDTNNGRLSSISVNDLRSPKQH